MYGYVLVCTMYIMVCTSTYQYVPVHTSMYQYIPVCMTFINVQISTYKYIRVHAAPFPFQKGANRSRTRKLLHTSSRVYTCTTGYIPQYRWKFMTMLLYIKCVCLTQLHLAADDESTAPVPPCRRPQPCHAPPEPGRGSRGNPAALRLERVMCRKETVTWQLPGFQYLWPGPQCHVSSESDCPAGILRPPAPVWSFNGSCVGRFLI